MSKKYKKRLAPTPTEAADLYRQVPGLAIAAALFATNPNDLFCIKNANRQYIAVNDAFVARSRMPSRSAVLGKTAKELFPPLLAAGYEQQDGLVLATGKALTNKLELITNPDNSTGWYLTQKHPIRHPLTNNVIAIVSTSTDLHKPAANDPRLGALATAIDRIYTDYPKPLRIASLAKSAGLSLSQFERRTKEIFQVSPRRLLTQTRIEAAARLLRTSDLPLPEIAQSSGFYDQPQFCRKFRAFTGLTPSQYRSST